RAFEQVFGDAHRHRQPGPQFVAAGHAVARGEYRVQAVHQLAVVVVGDGGGDGGADVAEPRLPEPGLVPPERGVGVDQPVRQPGQLGRRVGQRPVHDRDEVVQPVRGEGGDDGLLVDEEPVQRADRHPGAGRYRHGHLRRGQPPVDPVGRLATPGHRPRPADGPGDQRFPALGDGRDRWARSAAGSSPMPPDSGHPSWPVPSRSPSPWWWPRGACPAPSSPAPPTRFPRSPVNRMTAWGTPKSVAWSPRHRRPAGTRSCSPTTTSASNTSSSTPPGRSPASSTGPTPPSSTRPTTSACCTATWAPTPSTPPSAPTGPASTTSGPFASAP